MSDPQDVSGVWYGSWTAEDADVEPNGFIAQLDEVGGGLIGTVSERDHHGSGLLHALVHGDRSGAMVRWTKQYDGSGRLAHAVHYSGHVNEDATAIRGSWRFEGYRGRFAMQRERFTAEALEAEAEVAVPLVPGR